MYIEVVTEPNNPWFCGAGYLPSLIACLIHGLNPSISLQHLQPRHDSYFLPTGSVLSLHKHPESSEEQTAQFWMAMVEQILFLQNNGGLGKIILFYPKKECANKRGKHCFMISNSCDAILKKDVVCQVLFSFACLHCATSTVEIAAEGFPLQSLPTWTCSVLCSYWKDLVCLS